MSVEVAAQVGDGEGDMPALCGHYTSMLRLVTSRGPLGLSRPQKGLCSSYATPSQ